MAGFAEAAVVPLWQVGLIGLTSTSSVSLSQSGVMLTTLRTWPEVSPLVHSRCLVRGKGDLAGGFGFPAPPCSCSRASALRRIRRAARWRHHAVRFSQSSCSVNIPLSPRPVPPVRFQFANINNLFVEYRGRQRAVNVGVAEGFEEVFHSARAAGGDQRDVAHRANLRQLLQVVTVAHPVPFIILRTISPAPRFCTSSTQSRVSHCVTRVRLSSPVYWLT